MVAHIARPSHRLASGSPEANMGDFAKLSVWKRAQQLALEVYPETSHWPTHELFGLTSQSRRAAVSVPANIAEGCGKNSDAELAKHARQSMGSGSELSYYLILARDLSYITRSRRDDMQDALSEVRRMTA